MKKIQVSFLMRRIQGAIGKKFVVKHYRKGVVVTRFPDMTKIVASPHQRKCRDAFREAVVWAKKVMADPVTKQAYQRKLKAKRRLFNRLIKEYMVEAGIKATKNAEGEDPYDQPRRV